MRTLYLTVEPPVNLSPASYDPAFGAGPDASVKAKVINLIASVRTIMRSTSNGTVQAVRSGSKTAVVMRQGSLTYSAVPLIFVNSVIILYELILG